jgi:hypothetical protein
MYIDAKLIRNMKPCDLTELYSPNESLVKIAILGLFVIDVEHSQLCAIVNFTKIQSTHYLSRQMMKGRISDGVHLRAYSRKLTNLGEKAFNYLFNIRIAKDEIYSTIFNIKRLFNLPDITVSGYYNLRNLKWGEVKTSHRVRLLIRDGWIDEKTLMYTDQTKELFSIVKDMQVGRLRVT